jgi:CheY-like chemotaxis protein
VIKEMYNKWQGKTILVAEDVDTSNMFYRAALSKTGAKTLWAENGLDAIKAVEQNHVDIVLMDINMPEINGLEATKRIKKIFPDIPVIIQTAYLLSNEREKSFDAGADEFIAKPITYRQLLEILNRFLGED